MFHLSTTGTYGSSAKSPHRPCPTPECAAGGPAVFRARSVLAEHPAQLAARDRAQVHLVRTVGEPQRAGVRPHRGQREVLADPAAAVDLDGAVEHARARPAAQRP